MSGVTIEVSTKVRFRSDPSRVGWVIDLSADNARVFIDGATKLVPVSQLEPVEALTEVAPGDLRNLLTYRRLEHPATDQLLSYKASRTDLYYHQFIPVKKILESPDQRLLIADEVGTGKTISAGLIWAELESRSPRGLENVWIVCPKSLMDKWRQEMLRRFDLRLATLTPDGLREALGLLQRDGVLPPHFAKSIVNLELLRGRDHLRRLMESSVAWDLVVFDEAHHLRNPNTRSHQVAAFICGRSRTALFLTATPLQTSLEDIVNLMRALGVDVAADPDLLLEQIRWDMGMNEWIELVTRQPPGWTLEALKRLRILGRSGGAVRSGWERFCQLVYDSDLTDRRLRGVVVDGARDLLALSPYMTRTLRADIDAHRPVREAITEVVDFSPDHQQFYEAVYDVCLERARQTRTPPGFATQMPERRTASCLPAVAAEILSHASEDESDPNSARFTASEVNQLVSPAREALRSEDHKLQALHRILARVFETLGADRVMIFSTFRGTLRYLAESLRASGYTLEVMYGPTPLRDEDCRTGEKSRERIAAEFREGQFSILLASEVASEGLDFEHCHVVINYDLPWNPMRVEQRIGRSDRIGQASPKIYIGSLVCAGTIEGRILERLYTRLGLFEQALGHMEDVLGQLNLFSHDVFTQDLTPQQQEKRLEQILEAARQQDIARQEISNSEVISEQGRRILESDQQAIKDAEARFLSADDLAEFVSVTLNRHFPNRFRPSASDLYTVYDGHSLWNALGELVVSYPSTHYARQEILRFRELLLQSGRLSVSFRNGAGTHEFVHVRHPLVLLTRHLASRRAVDLPWCYGTVSAGLLDRPTMVVWAIASFEGYTNRAEALCASVSCSTGQAQIIPAEDAQQYLNAMSSPADQSQDTGIDVHHLKDQAEQILWSRFGKIYEILKTRDRLLVDKAKRAVKSLAQSQIERNNLQLSNPGLDPKLRRLYEGWNRNTEAETRSKLADIEQKGDARPSLEIVGMAVLQPERGRASRPAQVGQPQNLTKNNTRASPA